jgi:hypothetical protein
MLTPAARSVGAPVSLSAGEVWPELWRTRPALVFPSRPGHPAEAGEAGWVPACQLTELDERPRWKAVISDGQLAVAYPDGQPWYQGPLLATRDWRRAVRAARALLILTGPFSHPTELPAAAFSGQLLCAAAEVQIATVCW